MAQRITEALKRRPLREWVALAVIVAVALYSGSVNWSSPAAWVYLVLLLSILFVGLFRWLTPRLAKMIRDRRAPHR